MCLGSLTPFAVAVPSRPLILYHGMGERGNNHCTAQRRRSVLKGGGLEVCRGGGGGGEGLLIL